MSIFEILITSEDAFEVISCFFIRHCPLKQIIQRGIKETSNLLKQFCDNRKQTLSECQFQQSFFDVTK